MKTSKGWPMWYVHEDDPKEAIKIGTSKDDLIEWFFGGFNTELYVFGHTKAKALEYAKMLWGDDE